MPIDMHSHYYGGLVEDLRKRTHRPYVAADELGRDVLHAMTASTVMSEGYTDLGARLTYLDSAGIRTQLMTFPGALGVDAEDADQVATPIREFNDHLADLCRTSGGRFVGLAGLPLGDVARAAAELTRVRRDRGLLGAILPGGFFSQIERAEALRPVFRAANELGGLLMVHPGLAPGEAPPTPFRDTSVYRTSGLELQASISHMALTCSSRASSMSFRMSMSRSSTSVARCRSCSSAFKPSPRLAGSENSRPKSFAACTMTAPLSGRGRSSSP